MRKACLHTFAVEQSAHGVR